MKLSIKGFRWLLAIALGLSFGKQAFVRGITRAFSSNQVWSEPVRAGRRNVELGTFTKAGQSSDLLRVWQRPSID